MKMKTAAASAGRTYSANLSTHTTDFPAFTPVLSECVHFLHALPAPLAIPAGTLLVEQGRANGTIYLIETGLVKLLHVNAAGREVMIGLRSEGWYSGYTSAFLKTPSNYSVRTVTACGVVRIPASEFSDFLTKNSEMLGHFLSVMCLEVASQASLQVEVMSNSAEDRLERFMIERTTGGLSHRTLDPLPVLKQMELAQLLAITPEHLSRMMKKKKELRRSLGASEPLGLRQKEKRPVFNSGVS